MHFQDSQAEVHKVVVGPMDNNVYVLRCRHTGEAVLVDAANEHSRLLELCRRLGVTRVVETHGHWDHVQAVPGVRQAGLPVGVSPEDGGMLRSWDFLLHDDEVIDVGLLRLPTILPPGHTARSLCFPVEGALLLFGGDTLFPGGPGKTRSRDDFAAIIHSIEHKLFGGLDPETIVLPGHGDDTTIGTERPHLDEWVERGW